MNLTDALRQGAIWIASTGIVATGTAVISNSRTMAVHDQQIIAVQQHQQELDTTLQHLSTDVQQLNVNVAVLNERLADGKR